jgi:hypothetical protein
MYRSMILAIGIVLVGALTANAKVLPMTVTAGNIKVGATRTANVAAGYDEIDFYLTGMTGSAAGLNTDGSQCRINIISGRWTAGSTGAFWVPSQAPSTIAFQSGTTATFWEIPTHSSINFDAYVSAATLWTNTTPDPSKGLTNGGGRGTQTSGNQYSFFSGSWYTTNGDANIVYPFPKDKQGNAVTYQGLGTDSTYLAALYVTSATSDYGFAFDGAFSFTYGGGTVEVVHFAIIPEPSTLALVVVAAVSGCAFARRRRTVRRLATRH